MTDIAKLREALGYYGPPELWPPRLRPLLNAATDYLALLESPDQRPASISLRMEARQGRPELAEGSIVGAARALSDSPDVIVLRRGEDGEWPKKARQRVANALSQAASIGRRGELTVGTFTAIKIKLLDDLAALLESSKAKGAT